MCFGGPLPSRHRADISRRQHPSNRRRQRSSPSTLFRLGHVGRDTDEPFNIRRPCFPSGCVKSVEWLAFLSQSRFATVDVSSRTEDLSLPDEFTVTYTSAGRSSFLNFWRYIQRACWIFVDNVKLSATSLHSLRIFHLNIIRSLLTTLLSDPVARITYTVLVETLNPAQSINQSLLSGY